MRVLLRASALTSSEHKSRIPALLDFALQGKHDILLDANDPQAGQAWAAWCHAVGILGEASQRAIDDSNQRQSTRWSDHELIVEDPPSTDPSHLALSVPEAITFLQEPFEIGIEDETSDREFLNKVVPPPLMQEWQRLQEINAIKLWNLGGVTNAPRHLQTRVDADPRRRALRRLFVLVDSDAPQPWNGDHAKLPQNQRETIRKARGLKVAFHVLKRRMSENYTPPAALGRWVDTQHVSDQPERRALANAFALLTPERRHHHHLKDGLKTGEEPLYANEVLSPDQRSALAKALGRSTYEAITHASEAELHEDGVYTEVSPIFQAIFRLA